MKTLRRPALAALCILATALLWNTQAQTPRLTTVNVKAESDRARISAEGDVVEMRVEVASESGDIVFESGAITGNQLDWNMRDAQGQRVAPGTYLVTINFRNAAGKLRKRVEQVTVAEDETSGAQAATTEAAAASPITGTGTKNKIPKFTGASTIANSVITESAGKIGIGTSAPASKLTVAGMIQTTGATTGGIKFPDNTVQKTAATGDITSVTAGGGLAGGATTGAATLSIATGGVGNTQLATNAVTATKIAAGQVVKSINSLKDHVTLNAGANVTITPSGNTLTIASAGSGLSSVTHNATLSGAGTSASPLGVSLPLNIGGSNANPLINVINSGGSGITGNTSDSPTGSFVYGVSGISTGDHSAGVYGQANNGLDTFGVYGVSNYGIGIVGTSEEHVGVYGESLDGPGMYGSSENESGVIGISVKRNGIWGVGVTGVAGASLDEDGNGVVGEANTGSLAYGVWGRSTSGQAGHFDGSVQVVGTLSKSGGSFKIDHPLDPANKYLSHSFVESPDMMNIYNGNITTDGNGEATVALPDYFVALNGDYRYQLTVVGQFAQAMVAGKIKDNSFRIKTDKPGVEVSWQVTGIRQDAWAKAHRIPVEEEKPGKERGSYLHPKLFGQPEAKGLDWALRPELMKQSKERPTQRPALPRR